MLKTISGFLFSFLIFILLGSSSFSFAVSPQIIAYPTSLIGLGSPFTISATMSGLSKSSIYRLRLTLAQSGTSNYFGSTWNGTSWYNGTPTPINYANFYSITTDGAGAWWGDVQGEIDADDPNFTTGSGTYDLKLGRYTQTGSSATWSDPVSVVVSIPPQPTNTPTPIPTSTPMPPTATLRPQAPTPTKLSSSLSTLSPTLLLVPSVSSSFGAVLGTSSARPTAENRPTLIAAQADHRQITVNMIPVVLILIGFLLLGSCGILIFLQTEKGNALWRRFF